MRFLLQRLIVEQCFLVHVEVKVLSRADPALEQLPPDLRERLRPSAELTLEDVDRLIALSSSDPGGREESQTVTA